MKIESRELENVIHFKDGKYVLLNHKKEIKYDPEIEGARVKADAALNEWEKEIIDRCVFHSDKRDVNLYGARVNLYYDAGSYWGESSSVMLHVEGFTIERFYKLGPESYQVVIRHLNSIAVHGVDAFMENYKQALEKEIVNQEALLEKQMLLYSNAPEEEKSSLRKTVEQTIEEMRKIYDKLFTLALFLPINFENEKAVELSNSIINLFS